MSNVVLKQLPDGVARITLSRVAKRNALTREMLAELKSRVDEAAAIPGLRLVVLAADGPVFCAGMDLAQMQETAARPDAAAMFQADSEIYRDVTAAIFSLKVPTLAVVQGPAVAGGLGLVLACDMVLASTAATFALPEPKRGIVAGLVTPLLVHRVGSSAASWTLLSGRSLDANDALRIGLCHAVVPPEQFEAESKSLIASILSGSPDALAATKEQLRTCSPIDVLAHLHRAPAISARARETADAREGLQAFLEKRLPNWQRKN